MKSCKLIVVVFMVVGLGMLSGCTNTAPMSHHLIALVDISASIDPRATTDSFRAIQNAVKALGRGDTITVIPILGNADLESQGRVIRLTLPTDRQAFDQDLRTFGSTLQKQLDELHAAAAAHPGERTDILGALWLAKEEFEIDKPGTVKSLVILSDFIQDDGRLNFKTLVALSRSELARDFAIQTQENSPLTLPSTRVFLGRLRSRDLGTLDQPRRDAIQEFWMQYFNLALCKVQVATDGPAMTERFIRNAGSKHDGN